MEKGGALYHDFPRIVNPIRTRTSQARACLKMGKVLPQNDVEISTSSCMSPFMSIKTISLEIDAYDKLKAAKRGKESFSQVVRRARFDVEESTGASIVREMKALYTAGQGVPDETFAYWDSVEKEKTDNPRISPTPWGEA
jgi:hypothetical protein